MLIMGVVFVLPTGVSAIRNENRLQIYNFFFIYQIF